MFYSDNLYLSYRLINYKQLKGKEILYFVRRKRN